MDIERQPPHVRVIQDVKNEHWPENPRGFRDVDDPIPVRCRVVFDDDGEVWLTGKAKRWDADHCWCEIDDVRLTANGVWLKPADVYRSAPGKLPPK